MCGITNGEVRVMQDSVSHKQHAVDSSSEEKVPIGVVLEPPSFIARYACATVMVGIFGIWGKFAFVQESATPAIGSPMHAPAFPLVMTTLYLLSLPLLRVFTKNYLTENVDVKVLLKETMIVYNGGQVFLNAWMVYKFLHAVFVRGHPFIGETHNLTSGAAYGVWIHYMDKYLEFFDTIFMVLRGRMDQVSFLHVYHHVSIAWAWWFALSAWPGGDSYFGALLNSWIHVMMYSYYALSLLKVNCPWKRYLTQAQLLQFTTVLIYSFFCCYFLRRRPDSEIRQYMCVVVQTIEMVSLFVLFMHFYFKTYKRKTPKVSSSDTDSIPEQLESVSSETTEDGKKNL